MNIKRRTHVNFNGFTKETEERNNSSATNSTNPRIKNNEGEKNHLEKETRGGAFTLTKHHEIQEINGQSI